MFQELTIVGNLGTEPEMRYTPSGVPVTNFSMAVNRVWNDANGQKQKKTVWFRVACWQRTAEIAGQYLKKGNQVMVVGELQEPKVWTDNQGQARASLEVNCSRLVLLANGNNGNGASYQPPAADPSDEDIPF